MLRFKVPYSQDCKNKAEERLVVEIGLNAVYRMHILQITINI